MTIFATIPASLTRFILGQLYDSLPPPPNQDPDTIEVRNQIAQAAIARLTPMNTAEALLAVHAIASEAHASAALREAVLHRDDMRVVGQCRAQSALMIREAMQVRKELRAMQAIRREAEHQHQQQVEAAEREAAERTQNADETTPAPFMRRLAQRRLAEAARNASHDMGQTPSNRSVRLNQGSKPASDHAVIQDRPSSASRPGQRWGAVA